MGTTKQQKHYKAVPWSRAAKYTKRAIYLRRESTGEYLRVDSIVKHGPNLWVTLKDGRTFFVDSQRTFYANTTAKGGD